MPLELKIEGQKANLSDLIKVMKNPRPLYNEAIEDSFHLITFKIAGSIQDFNKSMKEMYTNKDALYQAAIHGSINLNSIGNASVPREYDGDDEAKGRIASLATSNGNTLTFKDGSVDIWRMYWADTGTYNGSITMGSEGRDSHKWNYVELFTQGFFWIDLDSIGPDKRDYYTDANGVKQLAHVYFDNEDITQIQGRDFLMTSFYMCYPDIMKNFKEKFGDYLGVNIR